VGKNAWWMSFCAVVALVGCASSYKEPVTGPKATIEFVDEAAYKMSVHFHDGVETCTGRTSAGLVEARSRKIINVPADKALVMTVGMDAGYRGQISLVVTGALGALVQPTYKGCTPTLEFVPEAGKNYVFKMNSDGVDCTHELNALPAGEAARPVAFRAREWTRAAGEAGPWCKRWE
jgi:hypothetical protein